MDKATLMTILICIPFAWGFFWMVKYIFKSEPKAKIKREDHWHRDKNGVWSKCLDKQCIKPKQI